MAVVTKDYLTGLLKNFRTIFADDFSAAMVGEGWKDISLQVTSNTSSEDYNWFGTVPRMAEGQPELGGLNAYNMVITNKTYKAGLEVERTVIEDDKIGMIQPRLRQLGPEAARHPGELIFSLFEAGGVAYDGVTFFSDTRSIGDSGNIDNIITGTGITVDKIQADIGTARATMVKFKDDRGRVTGRRPNVLVVPTELFQAFWQALNPGSGSVQNPMPSTNNGSFSAAGYLVIENPYLTDPNDWYALHVDNAARPFVFQNRLAPSMEGITDPETEAGILREMFIYTVRARYNVGYGDFTCAVKVTNT